MATTIIKKNKKNNTIRWDTVLKAAQQGTLQGKCTLRLTDDYQRDDADNFGRMEKWLPVIIRKHGDVFQEGKLNLSDWHFTRSKCWWNDDGKTFTLKVHCNLYYDLRQVLPEENK
jgi:hypothetical protein